MFSTNLAKPKSTFFCWGPNSRQEAGTLLEKLQVGGLDADDITLSAVLGACGRCSKWEHALTLPPDGTVSTLTANAVISALEKAGRWQWAPRYLKVSFGVFRVYLSLDPKISRAAQKALGMFDD